MKRLSDEEARQVLQAAQQNDGKTPLRYEGGFVHTRCNGPAEMAQAPAVSAYCKRCGIVVPTREIEAI